MFRSGWHFLHVYKNERVLAKGGRFKYATYILNFIKKLSLRRPFSVALTSANDNFRAHPLESIAKTFFRMMLNKILWILSLKNSSEGTRCLLGKNSFTDKCSGKYSATFFITFVTRNTIIRTGVLQAQQQQKTACSKLPVKSLSVKLIKIDN